MTKRKSRSTNKNSNAASSVVEIPRELVAAIKRSWPRDVVEEFDTDESYFHEIRHQIERDLRRISGVSLVWQTEDVDRGACDDEDEALPSYSEWQSCHVFFVSPEGDEFRFEDETIGEDPGDGTETAFSGEGRFGISLTISLAAPVAAIGVSSYSHYEDGGYTIPDPMSSLHMNEETGIVISANEYFRDCLGQEMFQKLEILREQITSIVALRHISVWMSPFSIYLSKVSRPTRRSLSENPCASGMLSFPRNVTDISPTPAVNIIELQPGNPIISVAAQPAGDPRPVWASSFDNGSPLNRSGTSLMMAIGFNDSRSYHTQWNQVRYREQRTSCRYQRLVADHRDFTVGQRRSR